jgi:hypothetical protein
LNDRFQQGPLDADGQVEAGLVARPISQARRQHCPPVVIAHGLGRDQAQPLAKQPAGALWDPLQNPLRSVIAGARAVHCVVFLANGRAIGKKRRLAAVPDPQATASPELCRGSLGEPVVCGFATPAHAFAHRCAGGIGPLGQESLVPKPFSSRPVKRRIASLIKHQTPTKENHRPPRQLASNDFRNAHPCAALHQFQLTIPTTGDKS